MNVSQTEVGRKCFVSTSIRKALNLALERAAAARRRRDRVNNGRPLLLVNHAQDNTLGLGRSLSLSCIPISFQPRQFSVDKA